MLTNLLIDHHEIAKQTQVENGLMKSLTEGLRVALAWKVQGDDLSRKLSTVQFISRSFQRHLERLMALEEVDGYMDIVLETKPNLDKAVSSLKQDHHRFRHGTRRIVHQLEQISAMEHSTFADICDELAELLEQLDRHSKKEAKLFQEAFEQEEGGEG